jgi:hypothetical protein
MGPNAQYNYESMFRRGGYGGEGGGDRYSGTGPSNDNYNMGVQSPFSPPNNGGPGNPGTANNMPKPMLPRFQQFQNNKGPAPLNPQDRAMQYFQSVMGGAGTSSGQMNTTPGPQWSRGNQAPPGYYEQGQQALQQQWNSLSPQERARYDQATQQRMGGDPFNQYGYAGQSPSLGRYIPPMMTNPGDVNAWNNQGGYAYNIPNSYGSGQWNQFNSRDVAFPSFGQSPNVPTPRLNPGNPPPSYQSPFGRPDPQRQQNYLAYMMNLAQGGQAQSNSTQPGAPDQPPPVV